MRYTNGQIEQAKMLRRRLSALENVSAPPLSRIKTATKLVLLSGFLLLRGVVRRAYWKFQDYTLCPHCHGSGISVFAPPGTRLVHATNVGKTEFFKCHLCKGKTYVGWQQRESVKWGRALLEYRLQRRQSVHLISSAVGTPPHVISQCEAGLVPLDDWPKTLYNLAAAQLSSNSIQSH